MDGNNTNTVVKGALLLTITGLISKLLSAGYRIPLQNLTGDHGFYIYQQVYPILGIAMIIALYGFPAAVSKMTVELRTEGRHLSFKHFYGPVLLLMMAVMGSIFLFLFFNAQEMAVWAGDNNLGEIYKLAAFIFIIIPFTALMRGVYQGRQQMKPTAYSQIGEQFVRVILIIAAAVWIYTQSADIYTIGQAAVVASLSGALAAILILTFFVVREKPGIRQRFNIPWHYYVTSLAVLGVIATLNHMILILLQFADTFTLVPGLQEFGLSRHESMTAKGVFDRGQPLIQLGTVLGSSFAMAMVPTLSEQKLTQQPESSRVTIQSALLISFYLAFGAALGLIFISRETNILLFQNDTGTGSLRILATAIFLSSIGITAASILQGLGYMKRTAGAVLVAFFLKWISNQILVPLFGIIGSAVATVFSLAVFAVLMGVALKWKLPELNVLKQINWQALFIAASGMAVFLTGANYVVGSIASRVGLLIYIMSITLAGAMIYLLLLLRWRAFTEKELAMLPFARKLTQLHKERDK